MHLSPRSRFQNTTLQKEEPELLREMTDSRTEQGKYIYKVNLRYLAFPEIKEVLKKQRHSSVSKGHRNQPKRTPKGQIWNNLRNKMNNSVLDYNPSIK